jgi:5'-deoxynucleotidase YfbR-like HD superfamily hydrolase
METKNTLDFLAEAGMLKRIKRSGWWMVGVPYEESVAEHSFRCAVIAYILARMEGVEPYKAMVMGLLGDIPEARINDLHKVASRYLDGRAAEKVVYREQVELLEDGIRDELQELRDDYDNQSTAGSVIARDADILECLLQAKEYSDLGFKTAEKFFKKAPEKLRTEAAQKLWKDMQSWDSSVWWERLGKFER